jgi:hypothetical protein
MATRLNTTTPIVRFMAEHLPEYVFDPDAKPNLVFRAPQENGLFRCIAIGRSSNPFGLYPNFAVTYNRHWGGEPASPLGRDAGIANLRLNSRTVPAGDQWITFDATAEGLNHALNSLYAIYQELAVPFFESSTNDLISSKLLQIALREAALTPPEAREGLEQCLSEAGHRVDRLDHPAFLRVRDILRSAWTPDVSKEERQWTSRLTYDSLATIPPTNRD